MFTPFARIVALEHSVSNNVGHLRLTHPYTPITVCDCLLILAGPLTTPLGIVRSHAPMVARATSHRCAGGRVLRGRRVWV